jgi:hypothetical protein
MAPRIEKSSAGLGSTPRIPGTVGKRGKVRWVILALLAALVLGGTVGCTRNFFRRRTDAQVDEIFGEKDKYAQWRIEQFHVYPDPRSRFADWTNPDRPPRPPDDPAAYKLSPNPQGVPPSGIKYIEGTGYLDLMRAWDAENRARKEAERTPESTSEEGEATRAGETRTPEQLAEEIESNILAELAMGVSRTGLLPEEKSRRQPPCEKPFMLNLEQTVELGFLCSREFQTIREELYLTALPVTQERFSFVAQPFVAEQAIRERSGRQSIDGRTNRWLFSTTAGITKTFPTGALLLLNFANQTVYNLGRGLKTTSVSTLNFDFIQPFLAGGGWAVTLEPLTQAERNLLYAIRDFYRFRQEYFVFFAAGQPTFIPGVTPGVSAITNGTVGTPAPFVPIATPLPTSLLNPATVQVPPGTGTRLLPTNEGLAATPQGYLGTVGERATLVNYYKNLQALQRFLNLFEVYLEGGIVTAVQRNSIEQTLLSNIASTLTQQVSYRISLDQLKQQLGLPMTVPIDVDDTPLQPMIQQSRRFEMLSLNFDRAASAAQAYSPIPLVPQVRQRFRRLIETTSIFRGTKAKERVLRSWAAWEKIPAGGAKGLGNIESRLDVLRAERQRLLDRRAASEAPLPQDDLRRLDELTFEINIGLFERDLRAYEQQPWNRFKDNEAIRLSTHVQDFRVVYRDFLNLLEEAFDEELESIRRNWAPLPQCCVEGVDIWSAPEAEALIAAEKAALTNRVDLMNVRAELVDSWRKIRVTANALLGTFTVDYHLDTSSPPGQARPFALGGSRTRNELIFNMTPPIVRVVQRNNYRSALIAYQQTRRLLMQNEDSVLFEVRLDLRNLRAAGMNYQRVQKRNIELAYIQVDQALQAFNQPLAPAGADPQGLVGPPAGRPQAGDPAALTTQLLSTQSSLFSAQNSLYSTWVNVLTSRMYFFRDLGLMPIDSRGVWIDDIANCECSSDSSNDGQQRQRDGGSDGGGAVPPGKPEQLPAPRPLPAAVEGGAERNN